MCDLETSRIGAPYIYIYIYDISSLRVNELLHPSEVKNKKKYSSTAVCCVIIEIMPAVRVCVCVCVCVCGPIRTQLHSASGQHQFGRSHRLVGASVLPLTETLNDKYTLSGVL